MKIDIDIITRDEDSYSSIIREELHLDTECIPDVGALLQGLVESVIKRTREKRNETEAEPVAPSSPIRNDDIPF